MKIVQLPTRYNDLVRGEQNASNAGLVTVTAALTPIASSVSWNVANYQWLWAFVQVKMTKGATAGNTVFDIVKSAGTATVQFIGARMPRWEFPSQPATSVIEIPLAALFKVTVGGTLTLQLRGQSIGSNGSVAAGDGDLRTMLMDYI